MVHPKRLERRVEIAEEVLEEGFKIENLPMEDIQMLEFASTAFNHVLSVVSGGLDLFLNINQESLEMIGVHDPILGVVIKELLDLVGSFAGGHLEAPAETETHSVGLLRHGGEELEGKMGI